MIFLVKLKKRTNGTLVKKYIYGKAEKMFCQKCGMSNREDDVFCANCGSRLVLEDQSNVDVESKKIGLEAEHTSYESRELLTKKRNDVKTPFADFRFWGNIIGFIGWIASFASIFLPYVSAQILGTKVSVTMLERNGGIVCLVILFVVLIVMLINTKVLYLVFTVGVFGLMYADYRYMIHNLTDGDWDLSSFVSREEGFYLLLLGTVLMMVSSVARLLCRPQRVVDSSSPKREADTEKRKHVKIKINKKTAILLGVIAFVGCCIILVVYMVFFHLSEEEKQAVDYAMKTIDEIGTVSIYSGELIATAEVAYAKLEPRSQRFVKNRSALDNAREEFYRLRIEDVEQQIRNIGEPDIDKISVIESAQQSYEQLYDIEKRRIENVEVLTEAVAKLPELHAVSEAMDITDAFLSAMQKGDTTGIASMISAGNGEGTALAILLDKSIYAMLIWEAWQNRLGVDLSYQNLDSLSRYAFEDLAGAAVKHSLISYQILDAEYTGEEVQVEVSAIIPLVEIAQMVSSNDVIDAYMDVVMDYSEKNKSSIKLLLYSMSEMEVFQYILMMTMPDYVSQLKTLVNMDALYTNMDAQTFTVIIRQESGVWKVGAINGLKNF